MGDFSFLFTEALSFLRFLLVFCKIKKPLSKVRLYLSYFNGNFPPFRDGVEEISDLQIKFNDFYKPLTAVCDGNK